MKAIFTIREKDGSNYVNLYQIFNVNGARVAVIGITPPYVPMLESSSPSHFKGLQFNEILKSVQKTVKELDGQYDVLIGSFHMGREDEYGGDGIYDIANKVPEFDIIFGGHEHAKYIENINNTSIVEPGFAGWAVSKADIYVKKEEEKWVITGIDVANIYKYANTLVGVNMTGENLLKFMEWSMLYYNTWNEGDVTISFNEDFRGYNYDMFAGVNYKVDLSKNAGCRKNKRSNYQIH